MCIRDRVDTDMIANSAVTTAKSSGLGTSTRTIGSEITLSNQSTVDFTGFGTITRAEVHVNALSCSDNTNWGIKIGTGGNPDSSGYLVTTGFEGGAGDGQDQNTGGFFTYGMNSAAYSNNGIFRFWRVASTENKWYCRADFQVYTAANYWFWINGYRNLSGALDIIRVLPISGTFDSGHLRLVTYSD